MLGRNLITKFSNLLGVCRLNPLINVNQAVTTRNYGCSQVLMKFEDTRFKSMRRIPSSTDDGIVQTLEKEIDIMKIEKVKFPDENTPDMIINNTRFADIPVCFIRVTKNNTIMTISDTKGQAIEYRSCGMEGYKNAKKGTNVAAQATAITLGSLAREKGVKQLRIVIKGLGPGRAASVKGLQMSGLNIVSITDTTRTKTKERPRKMRRV